MGMLAALWMVGCAAFSSGVQQPEAEPAPAVDEPQIQLNSEQQLVLDNLTFSVISYSSDDNKRFLARHVTCMSMPHCHLAIEI